MTKMLINSALRCPMGDQFCYTEEGRERDRERKRERERERERKRERLFSSSLSDGNSLWSFSGMLICSVLYCLTEAQFCLTVEGNSVQLYTLRVGRNSAIQREALPYGVSIAFYKIHSFDNRHYLMQLRDCRRLNLKLVFLEERYIFLNIFFANTYHNFRLYEYLNF